MPSRLSGGLKGEKYGTTKYHEHGYSVGMDTPSEVIITGFLAFPTTKSRKVYALMYGTPKRSNCNCEGTTE